MPNPQGRYSMNSPLGLQYTQNVSDQLKGKLPKDVFGQRFFDVLRFKAGAPIPTSPFKLFQTSIGKQRSIANAPSEVFATSPIDTNMVVDGQLPAGYAAIVRSIQVTSWVTGATDTAYGNSGPGLELPTDPTPAAPIAAANLASAILSAGWIFFQVGDKQYENGLFDMFPSQYGISGFAGSGSETNNESVANNGFGWPWKLPVERMIPPLTNFFIQAQFAYSLTPTANFAMKFLLDTIYYRPVQ